MRSNGTLTAQAVAARLAQRLGLATSLLASLAMSLSPLTVTLNALRLR